MDSNIKTYEVKKIDRPIQITGQGTDTAWEQTAEVTDFSYPWRKDQAPLTSFKARWDDQNLYFLYWADDPEIISKTTDGGEKDVVDSDRVEIFFKADDKMDPYYSLEMDALGNAEGQTEVRWISWVKPDSETPDFHIPSSFGVLKLIE